MNARKRPFRLRLPAASGVLLAVLLALALAAGRAGSQAPPAAPTIDSVTAAATSLTVAWSAPAGVTGITAYDVRYITTAADETADANWTVVDGAWTSGALEYAVTALEKGTEYDVQVRAVTTVDGQWSATTAATTTTTLPGATTLNAVTAGERTLGVAWSEPDDTGGAEISSYDMRYRGTGDVGWTELVGAWQADDPTPTNGLTRIISGLSPDAQYDVQVRASNSAGDGGWSATVRGRPLTDHSDDRSRATNLALDTLTSGTISGGDGYDFDWFRLVVAEETELLLFTRGTTDTFARLWSGQRQIAINDDGFVGEHPRNFAIATRLGAGTYYLEVEGYGSRTGDYLLETGTYRETTGRADAFSFEADVYANQIIGVEGDRDWFSFTLPEERTVVVSGIGQGTVGGRLLDSSGASAPGVSSIKLPGHDFVLAGTLPAGTWYVEVWGVDGTGLYHVRRDDVTQSGDTRDDAAPLALGGYAASRIDDAADVDYFRIDLSGRTKTTYVRITAQGSGVSLHGELLDSDGDPVPGPLDILFSRNPTGFAINHALEPGVHYLKVTRSGGATSGGYALQMTEDRLYAEFVESCEAITTSYSDPLFGCQWNLVNSGQRGGAAGEDINVAGAWSTTMGEGVTVAIVDDGVHLAHEDLVDNADPEGSHSYTSGGVFTRFNTHGTNVAGVVAARDNDLGVRGVAPRATIRALNYLLSPTDRNRAHAATHGMETVAVNTNSWGTGVGFRPSSAIWRMAVERGVAEGYGGKGVFYVWSAGNGGDGGDNVNYDGIANLHAVTPVCAVNIGGTRSYYSEPGAVLWVCAPSNDIGTGLVTTTTEFRYTERFGGTSAAAPAVAGVAALVRAANPDLTWRDVKLILAESARKNHASSEGWAEAGSRYAGSGRYEFNHEYGFGVVDATAAVNLASSWTLLPPRREQESPTATSRHAIRNPVGETITSVSSSVTVPPYVGFIEFVEINIDINHANLRDLNITLTSPSGTVSRLAAPAPNYFVLHAPFYPAPLRGWTRFGSARHLGEDSAGTWTLTISDHKTNSGGGTLRGWRLTIYGHGGPPARPALDAIARSSGTLTVTWSEPPALAGDPPVISYDLRYIRSDARDKSDEHWTVVTGAWSSGALSYAVSGLPGGVSYDVQVRGVNGRGHGDWSEMLRGITGPTAPFSPAITAIVPGDRFLTASWAAPAESGGRPVTAYDVQYRAQGSGAWTVVDSATSSRRYTIRNLANETYYDVQVRAVNAIGESEWAVSGSGKPRAVNSVPAFPADETGARSVEENTPAGEPIGAPVVASDADGDVIRYTISGAGARSFDLDPGTGQLLTKQPLDHESRASYALTVTATDVANARSTQSVTVTVTDVNEPPGISGPDSLEYAEQGTAPLAVYRFIDPEGDDVTFFLEGDDPFAFSITDGVLGFATPPDYETPTDGDGDNVYEVTVVADDGFDRGTHDVTITVTNVNDRPVITGDQAFTEPETGPIHFSTDPPYVGQFVVTDQDDSYTVMSLAGPDRDAFTVRWLRGGPGTYAELFFSIGPDYEAPRDANRDNTYEVTVQASDASSTASLPVTVTVENVEERAILTLSTVQPQVGVRVTATLDEPDGVFGASWQWDASGTTISGATSSSYTPIAAYIGSVLTATVTYTDGRGVAETVSMPAYSAVRAAPATNRPPAFPAETTRVRDITENELGGFSLFPRLTAQDPDGDPLTYSIDSASAAFFSIEPASGLLRTLRPLDREHRSSHRVTVTASDPSNARASIPVTVTVENSAERPVLTGPQVVFFPDGGTRAVATYRADDPENEAVTLTLTGDDSYAFDLAGGVLRFNTRPPDFANPYDSNSDNEYHVTITATDTLTFARIHVVVVVVDSAVRATAPPGGGGLPVGGGFAGGGGGGGGPSGPQPSNIEFEWNVTRDIEALDPANSIPAGAWAAGGVLWIANNAAGAGDAVYAYDLAAGERVAGREFALHERNGAPRGIWADGVTAWVADSGRDRLFAYDLASGRHAPERDIALAARNKDARGIWGDEGVVLVLDSRKALFAYDLEGGALLGEYALDAANADPRDAWSDGVTLWVSDHGAKRLFAYRLPVLPAAGEPAPEEPPALERVPGEEFEEPGRVGNNSPRGIWSDGEVMYVADALDGRVYSYNMPGAIDARLASLALEGVAVGEFDPATREYEGAPGEGVTETTVTAAAMQDGATVAIEPPDADGDPANGHQAALAGLDAVSVTVTSADGSRTRVYRVRLGPAAEAWAHCLKGAVAAGFSLVVYEGGSVGELADCAQSRNLAALYAPHRGRYLAYFPGAPEFVNRDFTALFADGVPALTPLIAASDGPPSGDPVGDVRAPGDWRDCLRGEVAAGFSLVLYEGGGVGELAACARSLDVTALYALHEGEWTPYLVGAPEFVNRPFTELYGGGLPALTPLVVRSGGPPADDPDGEETGN